MAPRLSSLTLALLPIALAGCSRQDAPGTDNDVDDREAASGQAPDISVSAAPGVAFTYRYRYALAADRIAGVQERHAAACEALGIDKCRITGLSFQWLGKDSVRATLDLALAPDLARRFGKDAGAAVESAKGKLESMDIDGVNRAPALQRSDADLAAARAEQDSLQAELARAGLSADARAQLRNRLAAQETQIRQARQHGDDVRTQLANTPMRLSYSTDGFLPGFSLGQAARNALEFAGMILNGLLALLIVLAVLAIPAGLIPILGAHGRRAVLTLWQRLAPGPAS